MSFILPEWATIMHFVVFPGEKVNAKWDFVETNQRKKTQRERERERKRKTAYKMWNIEFQFVFYRFKHILVPFFFPKRISLQINLFPSLQMLSPNFKAECLYHHFFSLLLLIQQTINKSANARCDRIKEMTVTNRHNFTLFFKCVHWRKWWKRWRRRKKNNTLRLCSCSRALRRTSRTEIVTHNTLPVCLQLRNVHLLVFYFIVCVRNSFFLYLHFCLFFTHKLLLSHSPFRKDVHRMCVSTQTTTTSTTTDNDMRKKNLGEREIRQKCRHKCE